MELLDGVDLETFAEWFSDPATAGHIAAIG